MFCILPAVIWIGEAFVTEVGAEENEDLACVDGKCGVNLGVKWVLPWLCLWEWLMEATFVESIFADEAKKRGS